MRYLIGPELLWMLAFGAAKLIANANVPPTKGMDDFIEKCYFYVPLLVIFCFAMWWLPSVEKKYLLPRVWVASLMGGHFVLEKILAAYSNQGPGISMGYLVGLIFLGFWLTVGTIIVLIKF
ncbi:MAG: hypothetical protein GC192_14950 [Bacteroidetes bacterium]|nr:hypothetical protein [Bacteroidota bacterium]